MKYLLDSNVLISLFKNKFGIRDSILRVGRGNCAVSELSIGELLVGAYKGMNPKQIQEVDMAKSLFSIIPVTYGIIDLYARNRAILESQGKKIDQIDLLIGSTAVYHNLTIVTHNTKHFERIPNIKIEDWEK